MYHVIYHMARPFYYRTVKRFLARAANTRQIQRDVLMAKLRRNADSDFGRQHGLADIRTVDDFRRHLPISDYDYFRDYIERVKNGDVEAMFAPGTKLLMFALTSGTTNKSKYIPVTREFFEEYRRSWYIWGVRTYNDHRHLMGVKTLKLASNWRQFDTPSGVPCGNISGLATELAPWFTKPAFGLPKYAIRIDNAAAKHYTALRISMTTRVGMIITANPSTLLEFARMADARSESLIRDIRDGTLSSEIDIPQEVREALRSTTGRKNPARAHELEKVIERTGTLYPRDFWPISMLAVWMGGSVGVYLPLLKEFYGETSMRDHGLSASEGRMTIPIQDGTSAGILDYAGHYYEFIPHDEMDSQQPTVLEAHELEEGKDYFILLTTSSGLYRYNIHDVVRCVDFEGEAPVLQFLNKGANFSSFTGEKLSEFQVVSAVKSSYSELDLEVESFTIAPVIKDDRPGYVMLLEQHVGNRNNVELARRVEHHLKQLNLEYGEKLESGRLIPLAVQEIPTGTWHAYRKMRTSERGNFEEFKHPCLTSDLEFVPKIADLLTSEVL